jgi:hypothetical protein
MARWTKHALGIATVLSAAGCTGSSCCTGPSVVDPLPNGFDKNARVEDGATVRITSAGFEFVQTNIGTLSSTLLAGSGLVQDGVVRFPIPTSKLTGTGYDLDICPNGPDPATDTCIAEIDLNTTDRTFTTAPPHNVIAAGTLPIRIKNLPVQGKVLSVVPVDVDLALTGGGNSDCTPSAMSFQHVDLSASMSIEVDRSSAHAVREGLSRLVVDNLTIDQQQMTDGLHACGGGLDANAVNALKGIIAPLVFGSFTDGIQRAINQQFCLRANAGSTQPCPNGTTETDGLCWYADNTCVSSVLGFEGRARLDGLYASFSPTTRGGADFLLAMGGMSPRADDASMGSGDLDPVAGGATLGMFLGTLPSPPSPCVAPATPVRPDAIPIPSELRSDAPTGWTGAAPHVGFALSERAANYALANAHNAGALCLGISTEQVVQLSTSLFALLLPSIKLLTHQKQAAPILVQLRPQAPATIQIGTGSDLQTDPLIRAHIDKLQADFHVWSDDRFIRVFTLQADLDIPVNLDATPEGILPIIDKIQVSNPIATNSSLLRETPTQIATGLADALSGLAGQFLGGIQPFDLSGALAPLGLGLEIDPQGLRKVTQDSDSYLGVFARFTLAPSPTALRTDTTASLVSSRFDPETHKTSVVIRASATHPTAAPKPEYSYRVDRGVWHPWTSSAEIEVTDPYVSFPGNHVIAVRSRLAGQPVTVDPTPALVAVATGDPAQPFPDKPSGQTSTRGSMGAAPPPPAGGSGRASLAAVAGLLTLGMAFVVLQRKSDPYRTERRRRLTAAAAGITAVGVAGSWSGCNCLDDIDVEPIPQQPSNDGGTQGGCGSPGAPPCDVLEQGLIGSHASAAVAADGTVWVAGYNEGDWNNEVSYGDLVVGKWDATTNTVAWQPVDGVPSDPPPDPTVVDVNSWRGGQTSPGDDVGLYTSIAVDSTGNPRVAYYDVTHTALKFAAFDGAAWSIQTVYQKKGSVAGKYAKLAIVAGKPVIAFQVIEPGDGSFPRSRLVLARSSSPSPSSTDWSFEDVVVDDQSPCRASLCPDGTVCVQSTLACTPVDDTCNPKCPSGEGCVAGTCVWIYDKTKLDTYPPAVGGYVQLATDGQAIQGMVYYDRARGNLVQAVPDGAGWITRVIDGQTADAPPVDTGNVGAGASLYVSADGDWHVAYADANKRVLRYVRIAGGTTPGNPEIVDDGVGLAGAQFPDAWHAVGEDTSITVTSSGEVRIAYQDATAGKLRWAVGTPSGTVHTWLIKELDQSGFAGFFPRQVQIGSETRVMSWWRTGGVVVQSGLQLIAP